MTVHSRQGSHTKPVVRRDSLRNRSKPRFLQGVDLTHVSATDVDWVPAVDILADETHYLFRADLPEMDREDVSVSIQGNRLLLYGERKFQKIDQGRTHLRLERPHGYFVRQFSLPDDAAQAYVGAILKKGVLEIRVARVAPATFGKTT